MIEKSISSFGSKNRFGISLVLGLYGYDRLFEERRFNSLKGFSLFYSKKSIIAISFSFRLNIFHKAFFRTLAYHQVHEVYNCM